MLHQRQENNQNLLELVQQTLITLQAKSFVEIVRTHLQSQTDTAVAGVMQESATQRQIARVYASESQRNVRAETASDNNKFFVKRLRGAVEQKPKRKVTLVF